MAIGIFRKLEDFLKKASKAVYGGMRYALPIVGKAATWVAPALTSINPALGAAVGAGGAAASALGGLVNGKQSIQQTLPQLKDSANKILESASPFIKFKKA